MRVTPRRAIRLADSALNWAVLACLLLLFALAGYAMWDRTQVYDAASAAQYQQYEPDNADGINSLAQLQAINPDVIGWLVVYGTPINYPLVQGPDDMKYLNTNAMGTFSLSGAIFLSWINQRDFSDFNNIIYGHHMDHDAMFGSITDFEDPDFFAAHEYGTIYFGGREHGIQFFASIHDDAYDTSVYRVAHTDRSDRQAYLDNLMSYAVNTRSHVSVTPDDQIVLLSTCASSSTNGRDILIGKILATVPPDPFPPETNPWDTVEATAVQLPKAWALVAHWWWVVPLAAAGAWAGLTITARRRHPETPRRQMTESEPA